MSGLRKALLLTTAERYVGLLLNFGTLAVISRILTPAEVGATATVTGAGISGKAAGLKLKAGAKNTITMKFSKAASGKATFKIVLKTNGRPTTETKSVTVSAR